MGVRRYADNVLRQLSWHDGVGSISPLGVRQLERMRELMLRGSRDSILWTPTQRGPLKAWHHVVTIHDCINVEHIYRNDWRLCLYKRLYEQVLLRASAIVAISRATKVAILRNYSVPEDSITVIPSPDLVEIASADPVYNPNPAPFALLVTNPLPHKNAIATCRAFALSRARGSGLTLHVVGGLPDEAKRACIDGGVCLQQHSGLSDEALACLYRDCRFLLSPSLSEGHDLPVAEALAHGATVLCSDIAAHREFYEGAVTFFDPSNIDAIVHAIDSELEQPTPLVARKWSPSRSFAQVAADYRCLFARIESEAKDKKASYA